MKALTFELDWVRIAAAKVFGTLTPNGVLSSLGPLSYREVPDPKLLGDEWVILQTKYCGICGSDLKQVYLQGAIDNPLTSLISFPHVMGHEVTGTVVETAKRVDGLSVGDRVIAYPWLTCAVRGLEPCAACARGQLTFCERFTEGHLGAGMHYGTSKTVSGGFAPLVPAHQSMCFRLPDSASFEQGALADPFSVALHAVLKAPPEPGSTVLVFGCGAIGMTTIHILSRLFEEVEIIAVDLHAALEGQVHALGGSELSTLPPRALVERIGDKTKARMHRPMKGLPWLLGGVEAIYDTVGSASTLETGLRIVRPGGSIVVVGVDTPKRFEWTPLYFKEVRLIGSNGCGIENFDGAKTHGFQIYLDLLERARIEPEKMITHRFELADYKRAFSTARDKKKFESIKVLFEPEP